MTRTQASEVIAARLKHLNITQAEVAKALHRSRSWVSRVLLSDAEKALRTLRNHPEAFQALLELLRWDMRTLDREVRLNWNAPYPYPNIFTDEVTLHSPNLKDGTRAVPVFTMVGAGPGGGDGDIVEWVDIPEAWTGDYAGYVVDGDSMSPTIPSGAIVVVELQDYAFKGDMVVCFSPEDGMLVKEIAGVTADGKTILMSHNARHNPLYVKNLTIIGIVVELRQKFRKPRQNRPCFSHGRHDE